MTLKVKVPIGTVKGVFVHPTSEFIKEFEQRTTTTSTETVAIATLRTDLAAAMISLAELQDEIEKLKNSYQS